MDPNQVLPAEQNPQSAPQSPNPASPTVQSNDSENQNSVGYTQPQQPGEVIAPQSQSQYNPPAQQPLNAQPQPQPVQPQPQFVTPPAPQIQHDQAGNVDYSSSPQPQPVPSTQPTVIMAQPSTHTQHTSSAQRLYSTTKSTKSVVTTIIAIIVSVGIVAAAVLWMIATSAGIAFEPLETRQGDFYTIDIPEGWNEEENTNTAVYRDGANSSDSQVQIALIRGQKIPNYDTAVEAQKDTYIQEREPEVVDALEEQLSQELKEVTSVESEILPHPNSDRAIRLDFAGINKNSVPVNGIAYFFFDDSGRTYFLISIATNTVWTKHQSDIEKIVTSFKPAEQ